MAKNIYCFDLDGTVTAQEILPLIAKELDLYDDSHTAMHLERLWLCWYLAPPSPHNPMLGID